MAAKSLRPFLYSNIETIGGKSSDTYTGNENRKIVQTFASSAC